MAAHSSTGIERNAFTTSGSNTAAIYTAEARGDLDCDGSLSNYAFKAKIDTEFGVEAKGPIISDDIE